MLCIGCLPACRHTIQQRPNTRPSEYMRYACEDHQLLRTAREQTEKAGCRVESLPYPGLSQPRPGVTAEDYVGGLQAAPPSLPQSAAPRPAEQSTLTTDQRVRALNMKITAKYKLSVRRAEARNVEESRRLLFEAGEAEAELEELYLLMKVCSILT